MADEDKKLDPTGKRLGDARADGNTPQAPEMRHAMAFAAMLVVIGGMGVHAFARTGTMLVRIWGGADDLIVSPDGVRTLVGAIFWQLTLIFMPLFAVLIGFALLGNVIQGMPVIAWKRVTPNLSKLSPIAGLKRLLSIGGVIELAKTLAKFAVVSTIAVTVLWPHAAALGSLVGSDPAEIGNVAGGLVTALVKAVAIPVAALAVFDAFYQRRSWWNKLKMSHHDVKDEHKQTEGDPKVKMKIRQIGMKRARNRMMKAVPDATVIITNPTHYAVALKYDHGSMGAPVVVAKGVDAIALKIREVATEAGVPIVENRPLARALYASAEIDRPIPTDHYAAVAEVIGYVMRLARSRRLAG